MISDLSSNQTITHRRTAEGLGIDIPAVRNYFTLIFLGIWLVGWTIGGIFALSQLFFSTEVLFTQLFLLVWLAGWAVGWMLVASAILWQLMGREVIFVTSGALVLETRLIVRIRRRIFPVKQISDLRHIEYIPPNTRKAAIGAPTISFNYRGKTIRVGRGLDKADAQEVIDILKKNLPSVFKSK